MEKIKYLDLQSINKPQLNKSIKNIVNDLYSGSYILNENVKKFEVKFAKFNNTKYCVGVNSGHDALKISLHVLGLKPGDKVIVPSLTFISTWYAITELGGIPVPIDVNEKFGTLDENLLKTLKEKNIKGIVAVNLYGNLCNYKFLKKYCKKKKLFLLEDSAQSHGAYFKTNKKKKLFGDLAAFSFYPGKNLGGINDGGAIILNSKVLYKKIIKIRNYGSSEKYVHNIFGFNSRLNSTNAIFLNKKIDNLTKENFIRKKKEYFYIKNLKKINGIKWLLRNKDVESSHHIFLIFIKNRKKLQNYLKNKGIETLIHYPKLASSQNIYFKEHKNKRFISAEKFAKFGLSLPLSSGLKKKEQIYIAKCISDYFKKKIN